MSQDDFRKAAPKKDALKHENLYLSKEAHDMLTKLKKINPNLTVSNIRRVAEAEIKRMFRQMLVISGQDPDLGL